MRLREVALFLNGEFTGDPETEIRGAGGIPDVREGEITFLSDKRLLEQCRKSRASGVIVRDFIPELGKPQIAVKNPLHAFARLLEHFYVLPLPPAGISDAAYISPSARIGTDVSVHAFAYVSDDAVIGGGSVIHPGVYIGNGAAIGDHCILYANVTVREKVRIGNRVIIHPGAVVGADGFGYVLEEGRNYKIPQVGGVEIGDDVEIGANVTIDRATTGNTVIGRGTKIDNLVQIAHNVRIGENCIIVAQVGIAGSSEIGGHVVIGGQAGVADHAKIEDGSMLGAKTGVFGHLSRGVYSGVPAIPHREWLKSSSLFAKLPELNRKIRELEEKIKDLERRQRQ